MAVSNTLTSVIPTLFAQGLMALRSNLVMPNLVWNDFGTEVRQKGENILVPLPSLMTTTAVVPAAYAPDPQNIAPTTQAIALDSWYESAFVLTEKEFAQIVAGIAPIQLSAAMQALAFQVNSSVMNNYIYVGSTGTGNNGTAGTAPFASSPLVAMNAAAVLTNNYAPMTDRKVVLNPIAWANATVLPQFAYALYAGDKDAVEQGIIRHKFGMDWAQDQQVVTQTAGTITTGLTQKAATNAAVGATSITGHTAASTGACALLAGDLIYISGGNATVGGVGQSYSVTANATQASAASDVTINISPGLAVALTGGETITVAGNHAVNMVFHKQAFAFASRPLGAYPLAGGNPDLTHQVSDPVSGISLRLTIREEFHRTRAAFDILWGTAPIRPALASRILG
jgi:hypothetical protein